MICGSSEKMTYDCIGIMTCGSSGIMACGCSGI
jgi:hypothetical protein